MSNNGRLEMLQDLTLLSDWPFNSLLTYLNADEWADAFLTLTRLSLMETGVKLQTVQGTVQSDYLFSR